MSIRFYNSLTQQVEPFVPARDNTVRMYSCGPTVYNYAHVGNLRTFTFNDILRRWLRARGFALEDVMNITDVEDKIIRNSKASDVAAMQAYTLRYEEAFLEDTAKLRLTPPWKITRATEHIPEMVSLIETLRNKGFTYESEGSTYYRIARFESYGKLSHNDFSGIRAGARVDQDEYDKDDARDFVLWKLRKEGEPYWDTSIGAGRPGWHIECSAMAMKYLGETLDIHVGGVDLLFPHHENEIAQSEAATGAPFARFWLHCEHLLVDFAKMSKSAGNIYTLRELVEMGYSPESIRYLLASVPYRRKLNFTFDLLKAAQTSIERLRNFQLRLETGKHSEGVNAQLDTRAQAASDQFDAAMDDDLNTAEALAAMFEYVRDANSAMDSGEFLAGNAAAARAFLARFDTVFAVLEPTATEAALTAAEIDALIAERAHFKKTRNFQRADAIRDELLAQGVILEDTKDGVRWKRK
jgi:cysteinyl-tRNA synthetase